MGELQVRLVDLVDQQHHLLLRPEGLSQLAHLDIAGDVIHAVCAELAVVEPLDHVVNVQSVLGLGGGLHVPDDELLAQGVRHRLGKHRLAGARLAFDQQGLFQRDGDVHGGHQILRRHVLAAAPKRFIHGSCLLVFGDCGRHCLRKDYCTGLLPGLQLPGVFLLGSRSWEFSPKTAPEFCLNP